ncbi:unnamed protein product [Gongylonema pulchrum]|uniref:Uncharacterized protein n=1 Tax=Gongylonema pulchrum TaxID=637853 RepID=A0A183DWR2_9BILA|nr:unnamed protein product [Gongylonema pulchrum]
MLLSARMYLGNFDQISLVILPQVQLRRTCYDFCPVQIIAIEAVSTNESPPRKALKQMKFKAKS